MKPCPSGIIRILLTVLFLAGIDFNGACAAVVDSASPRTVLDLDDDWRFSKGDFAAAMVPAFDDSAWRAVNLPHDWSSEGPFSAEYASGNGYAPGGVGWYRRQFKLDSTATNKLVAVEFDGVYDHSEVWFNGHFVGGRPYGYSSFECLLSKMIGIENGDLNDPATGKDGVRKAYRGRGLAIVQSTHQAGKARVRVRANGLNEALVEIETKP